MKKQQPPEFWKWERKNPYGKAEDMKYGYGEGDYRFRQLAKMAHGKILEVGFGNRPNQYLKGYVIGLDIVKKNDLPPNFKKNISANTESRNDEFGVETISKPSSFRTR